MGCVTVTYRRENCRGYSWRCGLSTTTSGSNTTHSFKRYMHVCCLAGYVTQLHDMIVLLYNQRKEEFIRQTLEEKRARGEIAGEFYAGTWLQFSSLFPCRPYQAFHGESLHGNEPVFMKWFYSLPTEDVKTLTANELSVFYKQFLDEKFQDHMNYSKLVTAHCYDSHSSHKL